MKGFWNYTIPVIYRAVIVKILPVEEPVIHWQNTYAGQERQAIEVTQPADDASGVPYSFLLDNEDGMGWQKIQKGGGPDSPSRHIAAHEIVRECDYTETIIKLDSVISTVIDCEVQDWQKQNHPEKFEELQQLLKEIDKPAPMAIRKSGKQFRRERRANLRKKGGK